MSLAFFPLYPGDFEADTAHLTLAEDGAYNRLLRLCWRTPGCSLPADRDWIHRRMRAVTDEDKAVVDSVLAEFFAVREQRYSNARLTKEWLAANQAHKRRVEAGSKGGKNKSLKNNENGASNAEAKPKQPEPEPEPYKETYPKGYDGEAVDFAKAAFEEGVRFLGSHGIAERQARSIVGRWRKTASDRDVFDALAACSKAGATDPVPWVTARLSPRPAEPTASSIFAQIDWSKTQ